MNRKLGEKLMKLTVILLLCVFLSGCAANTEIKEIRRQLDVHEDISMYICWPETSAAGIRVRRIVNNYNLSADVRVRLQFSKSEKEYLDDIRRLTATASLPDVFVMVDNPNDTFLRMNNKMADLSMVKQALEEKGTCWKALSSGEKVDGLFLAESVIGCTLSDQPLHPVDQEVLLACAQAAAQEDAEKRALEFDVDDSVDRGEAADYLMMLVQSQREFNYDTDLVQTLQVWKQTLPLFGSEAHRNADGYQQAGQLALSHAIIETSQSAAASAQREEWFRGYTYYLAATKQTLRAREEQIAHFMTYFLRVTENLWGSVPSDRPCLKTREMSVADFENLNEQLRSYAKNLISVQSCAQLLETFGKQGGWWK